MSDWLDDSMELDSAEPGDARRDIFRGESLDGEEVPLPHQLPPRQPLNSSFDVSLLQRSPHAAAPPSPALRTAASWDEQSDLLANMPPAPDVPRPLDMPELPPPATVRKAVRETPIRPRFRHNKGSGKLTPASARRHRALRSRSPHIPPKTPRAAREDHAGLLVDDATPAVVNNKRPPKRSLAPETTLDSVDTHDTTPAVKNVRPPKISLGSTVATAASGAALETTLESHESQDAPFRFSHFPASLPRIHPPGTARKRIAREDDTHNTSIGSLQDGYGYSDDDSSHSPEVARTRLDFASCKSPLHMESMLPAQETAGDDEVFHDAMEEEEKVDLSRPYEHQRINSFPSSVSSLTKNLSGCAEDHTASTSGMTPSRGSVQAEPFRGHETPHEVQLHFQLDAAQCSPIPGIPEEDGDVSSKSHAHSSGKLKPRSHASASSTGSASTKSSRPLPDMSAFVEGTVSSRDRSTDSVRPMPDMTAFDGCHSSRDRSTDESRGTLSSGKSHPPSPKLLCPPTPVRTPAWAHSESKGHPIFKAGGGHPKYTRANSLIATKVLATCSPQVLEGRASLENSMGEDSKAGIRSYQSDSVSTIAEADLPDSDTEEMVEDRKASPTKEGGDKNLDWLHTAPPQALDALDMNAETAPPAVGSVSMGTCFDILSTLGSGTFADVYKVKSRVDGRLYAVKRHRRQFRGRRDREAAMSEVRCMQRLQTSAQGTNEKANYSFYLLFFFQAWQEEGHFFCQTELCCRDTCREMMDSLRSQWNVAKTRYPSIQRLPPPPGIVAGSEADVEGRWVPESTVWKICHDVAAGLSHIHSHGLVHNDIKLANIFFEKHQRFGALCKIGDFGMARDAGSSEDGQEGDQKYMAPELLSSGVTHPSADIFSLGLTLYELASEIDFVMPSEGPRWHELRHGLQVLEIPASRSFELVQLVKHLLSPEQERRPTADTILSNSTVSAAGQSCDLFLRDYITDVEEFDRREEEKAPCQDETPRHGGRPLLYSPPMARLPPVPLTMHSPEFAPS